MMQNVVQAVAAIIWRGERFLGVDRPPGKIMAGYWEFPGGKVDPGETPEQAMARELHEELAITPTLMEYWTAATHAYDHATVKLLFYHVRAFDGEPTPMEGQNLAWLTPDEALAYRFLPADVDVLKQLARLTHRP